MHLATVSWISLAIGCLSAAVIVIDEFRRPQKMAVMNVVWPISALYFSLFALWAYYRIGRESVKHGQVNGMSHGVDSKGAAPTWSQVAVGTSHCGAGCVVADVCTEFGIAAAGLTLFGSSLLTSYVLDYVAAWAIGIAFQYFAIRPMRHDLSTAQFSGQRSRLTRSRSLLFRSECTHGWLSYFSRSFRDRTSRR